MKLYQIHVCVLNIKPEGHKAILQYLHTQFRVWVDTV